MCRDERVVNDEFVRESYSLFWLEHKRYFVFVCVLSCLWIPNVTNRVVDLLSPRMQKKSRRIYQIGRTVNRSSAAVVSYIEQGQAKSSPSGIKNSCRRTVQ